MKKRYLWMGILAAFLLFSGFSSPPDRQAPSVPADAPREETESLPYTPLFPGLDREQVTDVVLRTPQSTYCLSRSADNAVSVNGQQGDCEVFLTLLDHIADIPVFPLPAFTPQQSPLLTLTIRQKQDEYTAVFYDDEQEKYTRVVTAKDHSPAYGRTDGWHIGTLILACEGMRIQDENGKETPVQQ